MKKLRKILSLFLLLTLGLVSANIMPVYAATGDMATPYSAWNNNRVTLKMYSADTPRVVDVQMTNIYSGDAAYSIINHEENGMASAPKSDEQWILMAFNMKYISGKDSMYAHNVIYSEKNFFTADGQAITPIDTAAFVQERMWHGQFDVNLNPDGKSTVVWYGIKVKKSVGYPLVRIGDYSTSNAVKYNWYSTNPSNEQAAKTAPTLKVVANSYNAASLSWTDASSASGYEIYRSTSSAGTYTKIATIAGTAYLDKGLNTGTTYFYKVRSYINNTQTAYSDFSSVISTYTALDSAWTNHRFTLKNYDDKDLDTVEVQLTNIYTGDAAYNILNKENIGNAKPGSDEQWILMSFNMRYISGHDKYLDADDIIFSNDSFLTASGQRVQLGIDAIFSNARKGHDQFNIKLYPGAKASVVWYGIKVKKAVGYPLLRIGQSIFTSDTTKYNWFSIVPQNGQAITAPTYLQAVSNSYNGIKISWADSNSASGYEIYRSTSSTGTYTKVGFTGDTTYYDGIGLSTGTTYYYKVRALLSGTQTIYSSFSTITSAKPIPSTPTSLSTYRLSATSLKLTWSTISGATGYEVYRSTSSTGGYSLIANTVYPTYTNSGLTSGKTYYYQVRAYSTIGTTKIYSGFTPVMSART